MKKLFMLALVCIMISAALFGCNSGSDTDDTTPVADVTTAGEPEAGKKLNVLTADLPKYELIRPTEVGNKVLTPFSELMNVIRTDFGVKVSARDDFYKEGVESLKKGELEILVGNTNRDESAEFLSGLKRDEYGYGMVNDKIVIAGHSEEGTANALVAFIAAIKSGDRSEIFFDNEKDGFIKTVEYPVSDVKINGVSVSEYTFVYPSANKNMEKESASKIREKIADLCGAYPRLVNDKTEISGKILVFGDASVINDAQKTAYTNAMGENAEGKYYIGTEGDTLWVNSANALGFIGAISEISAKLLENKTDITLENGAHVLSVNEELSVMSFNLWVGGMTAERKKRVVKMIDNYSPDLMGVQEASPDWMSYLKSNIGNLYSYVGVGRNGGNSGEYSAIFYLKDKFTVIESGTKWLSSTPDVAGSKVSTSSYPRIMTYAIFERKDDGTRFLFINTHLEHTNEESRVFQIGVLLDEVAKLPDLPMVVTGDFNCTTSSDTYKKITKSSFVDAAEVAKNTSDRTSSTFHNYGASSKRIDFIFASSGDVYVDSYEVCDDKVDGDYVSDHHPIYAKVSIID